MNDTRVTTVGELAQVVAGHSVRIDRCEREIEKSPTATLAGHTVTLQNLAERMDKQEAKLTALRNWLIGVLATSAGSLAVLLFQQLSQK